jgi:hypothetical protein
MSLEQHRETLPEEQTDLLGFETAQVLENRRSIAKNLIDAGDVDGAMALLSTMAANKPEQEPAAVASEAPTAVQAAVADEPEARQTNKTQTSNLEEMSWFEFTGHRISKRLESWKPRRTKLATAAGVLAVGVALLVSGSDKENRNSVKAQPAVAADVSPSSSQAESSEQAETGWAKKELTPNDENRWLENGFPNIKKAETKAEARDAVNQWLDVIKGDPETLKFVYDRLNDDKLNKSELFQNGQSTPYAEEKLKDLQLTLAMSEMKKGEAGKDLKNPHNTGLNQNGDVVLASNSGVTGDTEAVIISTPDGKRIGVMYRCAQPVVEGPVPGVRKGPTDEPDQPDQPDEPDQPDQPDRPEEPKEGCPEGLIPEDGRCMHPGGNQDPNSNQRRTDPGRTEGYERGRAERVVREQQGDPKNLNPTPYGTEVPDSKEGGKAPGGGDGSVVAEPAPSAPDNPAHVPGTESPGTDEGTSAPAPTEGSEQVSPPSSDPGMPGASSTQTSEQTAEQVTN